MISTLRKFFVDAGVPVRIRTDGGPQFSSGKFRQFLKRWGVNHAISTPHYPQSNGHAEAAVKAMKSLVAKSTVSGNIDSDEFCEGHLEWLNTPKQHGLSPVEVLYGFPIRSIVPATLKSLSKTWKEQLENLDKSTSKERKEEYYNHHAEPLKSLRIGDKVRIQDPATKKWDRCGDIVGIGKNRDYHVCLPSGRVLWRNRRFVKPAAIVSQETEEDSENSARKVHFNDEVQVQPIPARRSERHRQNS